MAQVPASVKTEEEIGLIRESCILVGKALGEVAKHIQPGANALTLDRVAETIIRDNGGVPAFKGYKPDGHRPFPASLCISFNHEVVHGIPRADKVLREGDLISVDCGVLMNGYYGDSAYTFGVGEMTPEKQRLLDVTRDSLYAGVMQAIAGNNVGAISQAVQRHVEKHGFGIVQELTGHGVGRELHEEPSIPNYGRKWEGIMLRKGMTLAIEPMVTLGRRHLATAHDGWTMYAKDGKPAAHFEHTVVVRDDRPEILTTFEYIETLT